MTHTQYTTQRSIAFHRLFFFVIGFGVTVPSCSAFLSLLSHAKRRLVISKVGVDGFHGDQLFILDFLPFLLLLLLLLLHTQRYFYLGGGRKGRGGGGKGLLT